MKELDHHDNITYCLVHMTFPQLTKAYSFSLTLFPLSVCSSYCTLYIPYSSGRAAHVSLDAAIKGYKLANNRSASGRSCYLVVNRLNYQFLLLCYCVPLAPVVIHAT
jgi:hypothetical protein